MTSLIPLYEQPLIHAVGWSLLHFVWEGAIVALLLSCALRLLRGRSSQLRYMATCCALVLMAASPLATFGLLRFQLQVLRTRTFRMPSLRRIRC